MDDGASRTSDDGTLRRRKVNASEFFGRRATQGDRSRAAASSSSTAPDPAIQVTRATLTPSSGGQEVRGMCAMAASSAAGESASCTAPYPASSSSTVLDPTPSTTHATLFPSSGRPEVRGVYAAAASSASASTVPAVKRGFLQSRPQTADDNSAPHRTRPKVSFAESSSGGSRSEAAPSTSRAPTAASFRSGPAPSGATSGGDEEEDEAELRARFKEQVREKMKTDSSFNDMLKEVMDAKSSRFNRNPTRQFRPKNQRNTQPKAALFFFLMSIALLVAFYLEQPFKDNPLTMGDMHKRKRVKQRAPAKPLVPPELCDNPDGTGLCE